LALLLIGVGGVLLGGVISLRAQGAPVLAQLLLGALAAAALAGGMLRFAG